MYEAAQIRRSTGLRGSHQPHMCGGGHPLSGFKRVLAQIRRESKTDTELGTKFERLMVQYFKKDKQYGWKDVKLYPNQDLGIDIVARDKSGEMWAIQCKCYKEDSMLYYRGNVTGLWVEAEAEHFKNKIIVTTATPSVNLDKQCRKTNVHIIRYSDLESSSIEWDVNPKKIRARDPYSLYKYQETAMQDCLAGLRDHDRGQLIMACGTGKTLTALHIAEKHVGKGGLILYLVPSIALVKQSMQNWAEDASRKIPHQHMAVCSDKTMKGSEDISITDLVGLVTTKPDVLREQYSKTDKDALRVVFSTYHSADVVQQAFEGETFDMIIFDEAHRTAGNEGKHFGLAHHDDNIMAKKRLYMTATPRSYKREGVEGYSMNDEVIFGKEFHKLRFSDAIAEGILPDYKVVGLSIDADNLDKTRADADEDAEFTLEEECKLASIYEAIRRQDENQEPNLLRRVLVFHNKIAQSKRFAAAFPKIVERVNGREGLNTTVDVRHVDGKSHDTYRTDTINWLKGDAVPNTDAVEPDVQMVSNVRCFSEGVDVPALDGVVFCEPRQSVVDVIQAIGRVLRKTPDKKDGYVVIPVVASRNEAIQNVIDRDKSNKLILQIADALRAHDNRIDRFFNQAALLAEPSDSDGENRETPPVLDIPPQIAKIFDVLPATLLDTGLYWDEYGRKLGEKAAIVAMQARNRSESKYNDIISTLHDNLKNVVGDTITRDDTIDAVAQHLVLRPVFEALFGRSENPVWRAFDNVVDILDFRVELEELEEWHELMKYNVENITKPQAKQRVIAQIYGNFFLGFDPQQAKTIVYTPDEIVDFIINSIQHVLKTEFGTGFAGESVKVLDPFAGTGIFLAQLMESGHIPNDRLTAKYQDMDFGEIKLLAYYTACANLETTHAKQTDRMVPYKRGCLVDTFTIPPNWRELKIDGKAHDQVKITDPDFARVHQMRDDQRSSHIHVIMGNPPYSGGRKSGNERVLNASHPSLEARIRETYQAKVPKHIRQKRTAKNLYSKAIRWASDRIGVSGVIGFITPSGWITGEAEAGIRACLNEEFTDVYVFDLRGDIRKGWRKEGEKIFASSSTVGVAITILVKNPDKKDCTILYKDIGDAKSRDEKLQIIREFASIDGIPDEEWLRIEPNKQHDWLNQRGQTSEMWEKLPPMGSKDKSEHTIFNNYFPGLGTGRDAWVYNTSVDVLEKNMKRHIDYCNSQDLDNFNINSKQAAWNPHVRKQLTSLRKRNKQPEFNKSCIRTSLYRPFFKQNLYFDKTFVEVHSIADHFIDDVENMTILAPVRGKGEFSTVISNTPPERQVITNEQCFPFKTKIQISEKLGQVATPNSQLPTPNSQLPTPNSA